MSAIVGHRVPGMDYTTIQSAKPVLGNDWQALAGLGNWCHGHGGMLVPWCAIGQDITDTNTGTFHFRIAPKPTSVERRWAVLMLTDTEGASASVSINGGTAEVVYPPFQRIGRRGSHEFREALSSKPGGSADATVAVTAAGGTITVQAIACYEQTRIELDQDATDYGVDITTCRPGQPILDLANESLSGVVDLYKNMDARRACYFQWSTDTGSAISPGSTSSTNLFPLDIPILGPVVNTGDTTIGLKCYVYAQVDTGTGTVTFQTTQAGGSTTVNVTNTGGYQWSSSADTALSCLAEEFGQQDGRPDTGGGQVWEELDIDAADPAGGTLSIAGLAVVRVVTPI